MKPLGYPPVLRGAPATALLPASALLMMLSAAVTATATSACTFDPAARGPGGVGTHPPPAALGGRGPGITPGFGGNSSGNLPPLTPADVGSYGLGDPVTG